MPEARLHLSDWTLDQMAEGELPPEEREAAARHIDSCPLCAGQLAAYRSLFTALSDLPRFEPTPGFADAVLSRTRIEPEPGLFVQWLRRATPKTRRGWTLLIALVTAPALPILFAGLWLLTHPTLTAGALWQWSRMQVVNLAGSSADTVVRWAGESGAGSLLSWAYSIVGDVPLGTLTVVLAILAVGIPLSAWALFRLVRTPTRNITYAN